MGFSRIEEGQDSRNEIGLLNGREKSTTIRLGSQQAGICFPPREYTRNQWNAAEDVLCSCIGSRY